ncbi:MAG: aminoglycoside phosphotransferase, partial [Oscillospiraceae bacterium]
QFGKTDGKWSISMDFIEGKTLDVLMHENPSKLDEYLVLFVDLQLEILSKQSPLLNNLTQKMHRKINETTLDATTR